MGTKKTFNFKLEDKVQLTMTGEAGIVMARAHYVDMNPNYLVRYKAANGCQREDWLDESAVCRDGEAVS